MIITLDFRRLAPDHLDFFQRPLGQNSARHRRARAAFALFRKGKINEPVLGKVRRPRNIEQPALPARSHFGHAAQGFRNAAVTID